QIAEELQINPMTVSKAWSLLERDGAVERVRGQGMKVSAPSGKTASLNQRLQSLQPTMQQLASQAWQLGLSPDQVVRALKPLLRESAND
ncbi:MAG: GntR family transcriptional regulator, partial [Planctomycetaceae bacterium]|nr:GntR family transcriptional regulator [Planctomycetaceae bacterium]